MKAVELNQVGLDRLLHAPEGPLGRHLLRLGREVHDHAEAEGEKVRKGKTGFVEDPEFGVDDRGLFIEIKATTDTGTHREMAAKARKEGANSWLGRGLETI